MPQSIPQPNTRRRKHPRCVSPRHVKSHLIIDPEAARHPVLPLSRRELGHLLVRIMEIVQIGGATVELRITSDQDVATLHHRYMGGVGPTNVLSFPADASGPGQGVLGSIIISADAVIREAYLYQQDADDHFIRLLTHALLHLAEFEHGTLMDEITEHVVEQMQLARKVY